MAHIAHVRTLYRLPGGALWAHVLLTTTSPRMIANIPPRLSIRITEAVSRRMGMRNSFVIDIHRVALLPLDSAWFPAIDSPSFVISQADEQLRTAIAARYAEMLTNNPSAAINLGPRTS